MTKLKTKDSIHQGILRILNVYAYTNIPSKYTKQKLAESQEEIILRNLNTFCVVISNEAAKNQDECRFEFIEKCSTNHRKVLQTPGERFAVSYG
jgi:hypothetical protein